MHFGNSLLDNFKCFFDDFRCFVFSHHEQFTLSMPIKVHPLHWINCVYGSFPNSELNFASVVVYIVFAYSWLFVYNFNFNWTKFQLMFCVDFGLFFWNFWPQSFCLFWLRVLFCRLNENFLLNVLIIWNFLLVFSY